MSESEFVKEILRRQRRTPERKQVDAYYGFLEEIRAAKRAHDYREVWGRCLLSLWLVPALISDSKREYGRFDIQSIPALEEGFKIAVALGARGQMKNFIELADHFRELEAWAKEFKRLAPLVEVSERIRKHDGVLQKELNDLFAQHEPRDVGRVAVYMERLGVVKREKVGRTFRLTLLKEE